MSRYGEQRDRREGADDGAPEPQASPPGKRTRVDSHSQGAGSAQGRGERGGEPALDQPAPDLAGPAEGAIPMTEGDATVTHEAAADADAPVTRKTVGVGETVYFTADRRGGWSADAALTGKPTTKRSSNTYDWVAPATPASVTITFDPGGGGTPTTVTMNVIKPSSVQFTKLSEDAKPKIPKGTPGAGVVARVEFLPFTVSFQATEWKEIEGPGSNPTGTFVGRRLPRHHPQEHWLGMGIKGTGPSDWADFRGMDKPWEDGTYDWVVPNHYRVKGESTDTGHHVEDVTQRCTLQGDPSPGTVTISKGGNSATRDP